jgi:predicted ATPase with chaperone activity
VTPESPVAQPEPERRAPVPPEPSTIEDTGLGYEALKQLLTKALFAGEVSGLALGEKLCLPYGMLESLLEHLRVEKLIEVRGAAGSGTAGFRYALTDLGRERAQNYLDANGYIGPAPVPLKQYAAAMQKLKDERGFLTRERIAHGFTHLIVSPETLDQLGPAVNSGKSIFLYGPPGNGKTVVAEGIGRALGGDMYVPWALDIDGQIITIFDPVNHVRLEDETPQGSVIRAAARDRRWVRIRRPVVTVGGELTLEMLDLSFNPIAKFYEAPLQLKANGGVFVVDDFGRQRIRPRDLLNRWIVPLESRVDFLTLHTGKKFEMPFDVLIVFATNLNPESLADEAFLRRIPYKIYAKNPTTDEFTKIFALNCKRQNVPFDPVVIEYLQRRYYEPRGLDMRACHPRDLVAQVVDMCRYQNKPPQITRELLDHACKNYFLEEQASKQAAKARLRAGGDGRTARVAPAVQKPAAGPNGAEKRPPAKEEWLS